MNESWRVEARAGAFGVVLMLAASVAASAQASSVDSSARRTLSAPAWAFPTTSPPFVAVAPPYDSVTARRLPKSRKSFTFAQVKDLFYVPDWYPDAHPHMPDIVARGRKPGVFACGYCHLPDGRGRSENAELAGLPVEYFARQVADMRSGARKAVVPDWGPSKRMHDLALVVTDSEVAQAAKYFSRIRPTQRYRVVERATIPLTYAMGGLYAIKPERGTEPLGQRIIEVTDDAERHELRDALTTFTAYVPPGSLARGRALASASGTTPATGCKTCHGPALRGIGDIPPIAGRSASYIFRQLLAFKTGTRATPTSVPMQLAVSGLNLDDLIAAAAYAGSLRP